MKFISIFLPVVVTISSVFASPIPVEVHIKPEASKTLKAVHPGGGDSLQGLAKIINKVYIPAMHHALKNYATDAKAKFALQAGFGEDFEGQKHVIEEGINKLAHYVAIIGKITDHIPGEAGYDIEKKEIMLSPAFFKLHGGGTPNTEEEWLKEAAPVMIHELSHAVSKTYDYFWRNGFKGVAAKDKIKGDKYGYWKGYLQMDFKKVRNHGAATQVQNADAWLVFSHVAVHGDVDLTPYMPKILWAR